MAGRICTCLSSWQAGDPWDRHRMNIHPFIDECVYRRVSSRSPSAVPDVLGDSASSSTCVSLGEPPLVWHATPSANRCIPQHLTSPRNMAACKYPRGIEFYNAVAPTSTPGCGHQCVRRPGGPPKLTAPRSPSPNWPAGICLRTAPWGKIHTLQGALGRPKPSRVGCLPFGAWRVSTRRVDS